MRVFLAKQGEMGTIRVVNMLKSTLCKMYDFIPVLCVCLFCDVQHSKFSDKILAFHLWDKCQVSVHVPTYCGKKKKKSFIIPQPGSSEKCLASQKL